MRPMPMVQFSVHQDESGTYRVDYVASSVARGDVERALRTLFGEETSLQVRQVGGFDRKIIQYTSALPGAQA